MLANSSIIFFFNPAASTNYNSATLAFLPLHADYVTVIVTVAGLLTAPVLSVTVRLNVRDVVTVGAVNVGVPVFAPFSETDVPDVCIHE